MNSRMTTRQAMSPPEVRLFESVGRAAKREVRAHFERERALKVIKAEAAAAAKAEAERITKIEALIEEEKAIEIQAVIDREGVNNYEMHDTRGGEDFVNANLMLANFNYANLEGVDFTGANLRGATFEGANLTGAILDKTNMVALDYHPAAATHFNNAMMKGAFMRNARIVGASFVGANLIGAQFNGSIIDYTDFTNAELCNAKVCETTIMCSVFVNTNVHSVNFIEMRENNNNDYKYNFLEHARNKKYAAL